MDVVCVEGKVIQLLISLDEEEKQLMHAVAREMVQHPHNFHKNPKRAAKMGAQLELALKNAKSGVIDARIGHNVKIP